MYIHVICKSCTWLVYIKSPGFYNLEIIQVNDNELMLAIKYCTYMYMAKLG